MKKETIVILNRSEFLAASASVAASASAGVPGGTHRVERRADFDERAFGAAVGRPAQIRQVYEATVFDPAVLGSIKNSFNGLQFGFGYPPQAIAIVLAGHGPSSIYAYTDYLWTKYRIGEFFSVKDGSGNPVTGNVFLSPGAVSDSSADPDDARSLYQQSSIAALMRRGMIVLTCHTAVEEQAAAFVRKSFAPSGMTTSEVAADILTHLIPGAIVVPSMVATIAVLQTTFRYSYLSR